MTPTIGPIARKLIEQLKKFKNQKANRIKDLLAGNNLAEDLQKTSASKDAIAQMDPAHAIYVRAQNQTAVMFEQMARLPPMEPFADLNARAQDEYMPGGPPMSPLTTSYFTFWAYFDLCAGEKRETVGTCILAIGSEFGMSPSLLQVIQKMQDSRMGFYSHAGLDGRLVVLEELITGSICKAICPSGYRGKPGELWLVRILPPPVPEDSPHVVITTPYLILGPDRSEWQAYFERTLGKLGLPDHQQAYERLLKYGLSRNYWNEYIFEAYVNFQKEAIFLHGLPDVAESRPHSRVNS
jgi:hypothetical protein